jgi:hypothetical protein
MIKQKKGDMKKKINNERDFMSKKRRETKVKKVRKNRQKNKK